MYRQIVLLASSILGSNVVSAKDVRSILRLLWGWESLPVLAKQLSSREMLFMSCQAWCNICGTFNWLFLSVVSFSDFRFGPLKLSTHNMFTWFCQRVEKCSQPRARRRSSSILNPWIIQFVWELVNIPMGRAFSGFSLGEVCAWLQTKTKHGIDNLLSDFSAVMLSC